MVINIQDDILILNNRGLLNRLLEDKTTKKNIMWATDAYSAFGERYFRNEEIRPELITGANSDIIKTRARKAMELQFERTRQRAEVFTPMWICKRMNDDAGRFWFEDNGAATGTDYYADYTENLKNNDKLFKRYIDSKWLEITCGEAPYLVSRYDVATGEMIPVSKRSGILDRKLQVIGKLLDSEDEWLKWVIRAYQATFGYEFQGDNVLISRVNMLMTFAEYMEERWCRKPTNKECEKLANIIAWNIWQMDGLTFTIPYRKAQEHFQQLDIFGLLDEDNEIQKDLHEEVVNQPYCRIYDWRNRKKSVEFQALKKGKNMKFDFIIGNPPYQEESVGANANDTPLYHFFYDEAFQLSDKVELISPARFLFNAGGTPKAWNEKMLSDDHIKVMMYEQKSEKIFPGVSISGGVAVIYRDANKSFGAIDTFTPFQELNSIVKKVDAITDRSLMEIVSNRGQYRYSDLAYSERPEEMKLTADRRIAPSAFERMPELFTDSKPDDTHSYIRIYGNDGTKRVMKWFRRDYVSRVENLDKYKVFISKADGAAGQIGNPIPARISGKPVVMGPGIGSTETYISVGSVDSEYEAEAIAKYIQTRFCRLMLGVLKVTQNYAKPTWRKIPMQDFSHESDINWSQPIPDIDHQLYAKYGLNQNEIDFIEAHIKEME